MAKPGIFSVEINFRNLMPLKLGQAMTLAQANSPFFSYVVIPKVMSFCVKPVQTKPFDFVVLTLTSKIGQKSDS